MHKTKRAELLTRLLASEEYAVLLSIMKTMQDECVASLMDGPWESVIESRARISAIRALDNRLQQLSTEEEQDR